MSTGSPFRRRTAWILAVVGGVALAATLAHSIFGPRMAGDDPRVTSLRRSAVGYAALVELLRSEAEVEPAPGRYPSALGPHAPLLVLEPRGPTLDGLTDTVEHAVGRRASVVVVLPKWRAVQHPRRTDRVGGVVPRPVGEVRDVVTAVWEAVQRSVEAQATADASGDSRPGLGEPPRVIRTAAGGPVGARVRFEDWSGEARVDLPHPQLLTGGAGLVPWVETDAGVLVGSVGGHGVFLVSDPDLLNVAGLGRADHALLAHRLLLASGFAETWLVKEGAFGGLPPRTSLWAALLRPPLALVSLHLVLVGAVAAWIAADRFGRPASSPPRVSAGKRTLVDNTARLLATAGDPGVALDRYLRLTAERAAERLSLPPGLDGEERLRRLDRVGRRRGAGRSLAGIVRSMDELPRGREERQRHAVELAMELHRWYREVCDGPERDR